VIQNKTIDQWRESLAGSLRTARKAIHDDDPIGYMAQAVSEFTGQTSETRAVELAEEKGRET
jgi:hypothetical protein